MQIKDDARKKLDAFAWPGGYPIMYFARDGWRGDDGLVINEFDRSEHVCCAKCAADVKGWPYIIIVGEYIHWEGEPEQCEYCSGETESAYGVPESDKVTDES